MTLPWWSLPAICFFIIAISQAWFWAAGSPKRHYLAWGCLSFFGFILGVLVAVTVYFTSLSIILFPLAMGPMLAWPFSRFVPARCDCCGVKKAYQSFENKKILYKCRSCGKFSGCTQREASTP